MKIIKTLIVNWLYSDSHRKVIRYKSELTIFGYWVIPVALVAITLGKSINLVWRLFKLIIKSVLTFVIAILAWAIMICLKDPGETYTGVVKDIWKFLGDSWKSICEN